MPDNSTLCPLCNGNSTIFYQGDDRLYHQCITCNGIFLDHSLLPTLDEEQVRYEEHNNDVLDPDYQQFVSPITEAIKRDFTTSNLGLDFGAGTGPVISKVLSDNNYEIKQYDPIFIDSPGLLKTKYDYIACCEVIEHFHKPSQEFKLLKSLLEQHGKLYCMTHIYDESINFSNWYYKNDPTHVFIYTKQTIYWIKESFGFSDVQMRGRLIVYAA